jgi:hypothetical protein
MNYKLKHLAKFCCKPANELEFEAVKMAAEIGGVEKHRSMNWKSFYHWFVYVKMENNFVAPNMGEQGTELIPVLDFINKLRMTEEEAEKLEDDRVASDVGNNWEITDGAKVFKALNGHYFKTNDDGTEVTLHKRD